MKKICIKDKNFSLKINKKNISSIRLRLIDKRSLEINVPLLVPQFFINSFIKKNSEWILAQSKKIKNKSLKSLKKIKILDKDFKIIYNKTSTDSVIIDKNEQTIYINTSSFSNIHLNASIII